MTSISECPKWVLGSCICPWGRNRALFRSMIDGFQDIGNRSFGRVIIGDFHDERLKMAKMGLGSCICPQGQNRAPFRSTIDDFQDIGNQSFGRVIIGDFHDEHLKMGLGHLHMPLWSKSSSVSLYDRRFSRYRQSKFRASDNREFS